MPDLHSLRADALALFHAAIDAANPEAAVKAALAREAEEIRRAARVFVVAIGKGAVPMLSAALASLGRPAEAALALTNYENAETSIPGAEILGAAHPVPDENGLKGAARIEALAASAGEGDLLLVLMSGGGSALLCAPAEGLTLADKIALNAALLASGAEITEMNTVRSMASRLKGGRLARLAAPARVLSLILSDVPGDDVAMIASGPTVPSAATAEKAAAILDRYGLRDRLPTALVSAITGAENPPAATLDTARAILVGGNSVSVAATLAAAEAAGYAAKSENRWLDGETGALAQFLLGLARGETGHGPVAHVNGGEPVVILTGKGKGGRNQELALKFALAAEAEPLTRPWVFLSGGTDGRDGPTDAAGALVDAGTLSRMRAAGIDPLARLADNDSYPALSAAGDLVMTGGTGTNVADIQILLLG